MSENISKDTILKELTKILTEDFEIDEAEITPQANLFEDLELDSIDAVDLAVRVQQFTHKKISPENFKQIRTIEDVVNAIDELLCE